MKIRAGAWKRPLSGQRCASWLRDGRFRGARRTPVCATTSTTISCTSSTDLFRSALRQQFGGDQGRFVPSLLPDAGNQCMGGRISQLVELTLQRGGCRFGVKTGGGDALVSEKALQIGDVH